MDVDVKDLASRYGSDVIASCAFGLKVDSYKDENNQFYAMGNSASSFNFHQILVFLLSTSFPTVSRVSTFNVLRYYLHNDVCDVFVINVNKKYSQYRVLKNRLQKSLP